MKNQISVQARIMAGLIFTGLLGSSPHALALDLPDNSFPHMEVMAFSNAKVPASLHSTGSISFMLFPNGQELWVDSESFSPSIYEVKFNLRVDGWKCLNLEARLRYSGFGFYIYSLSGLTKIPTQAEIIIQNKDNIVAGKKLN